MYDRKRLFTGITIITLLFASLFVYKPAMAGCCNSQSYANTTVISRNVNQTISSVTWKAIIESEAYANMNQIGWTWWHVYEVCGGNVIDYKDIGRGDANNTSFRAAAYNNQFNICTTAKQTGNKGNHYFLKSGYSYKYVFVDNVQNFP